MANMLEIEKFSSIHKFGGKGLIDLDKFNQIIKRLDFSKSQLIIVSALAKTTSHLQELLELAVIGNYQIKLQELVEFHQQLAMQLFGSSKIFDDYAKSHIEKLESLLKSVSTLASYDLIVQDYVLAIGEYWSTFILAVIYLKLPHLKILLF